jgi:hypothetical protein
MDASALETAISIAEKSFDFWSFWLLIATLVVVVGLVTDFGAAAKALASALVADGIKATAGVESEETTPATDQRIHVKVGSRPAF